MAHIRSHFERCRCSVAPADPASGPRPFRLPGDPERFGRPRPYDLQHLTLEGRLDIVGRRFEAVATLRISPRDPDARTLVLDAVAFEITSVSVLHDEARTPAAYRYDGDRLHVPLGERPLGAAFAIEVKYTVEPKRGLYFIQPDAAHAERPYQVWSQCQDEDAKYWIPCHDFPNVRMSTEFIITAPEGWTVISNGALQSHVRVPGTGAVDAEAIGATGTGQERWHWLQSKPHVAYLMTLVAGRFAEIKADLPTLPVRYYVDPGREADGMRAFHRTPEMIAHFGKLHGVPFPWAKYYQVAVHDFIFGGMENTSATTMTDRILLDERAEIDNTADEIVAHELAHQWFGDLVTCRDWSHAWLNEGFATFYEHLDWEKKGGRDAYLYSLKEHGDAYFAEDEGRYRRPVVCNTYASPIDLFDRHLYEKGGWVLHMLRSELGDTLFFGGVKRYLERHAGGIVETRDLLRAMEDESGRSLEGFFEQWIFKAGFPEIEVETAHDADKGVLSVTVRQRQTVDAVTPLFQMQLRVVVVHAHGEESHTLSIGEPSQTFALRCAAPPKHVAIDPDGAILMRLTQRLPRDASLHALAHDPRAVVRWRAAATLSRRSEPRVVKALADSVRTDAFWGVAAESALALGEMRSDTAFRALLELLDVKHPKVRRAVVQALGEFRTEASATALADRLLKGDPSVLVEAELARSAGRTRQPLVFDALMTALDRPSWRDAVRIGAMDGLARLRDDRALPRMLELAAPSAMLGTRRSAAAALAELGENKRAVRERLEELLDPGDPYFTPEVIRTLVKLKDPASLGAIARLFDRSLDGRVKRHAREAIRDLRRREQPDEVKRLSDALDRLRDEQQSLRDDVARLRTQIDPEPTKAARPKPTRTTRRPAVAKTKATRKPARRTRGRS